MLSHTDIPHTAEDTNVAAKVHKVVVQLFAQLHLRRVMKHYNTGRKACLLAVLGEHLLVEAVHIRQGLQQVALGLETISESMCDQAATRAPA